MNKGEEPENATKVSSTYRYPLGLVASLAVHLIDHRGVDGAAKRAVSLLDACTAVLEGRGQPEPDIPVSYTIDDMNWDEFVRFLTVGKRADRAESTMNDFLKFEIKRRKADRLAESAGVTQRKGAWKLAFEGQKPFIDQVDETTPAELNDFTNELKGRGLIARNLVRIFKDRFATWLKYEKTRIAREKGKKGGRPLKA